MTIAEDLPCLDTNKINDLVSSIYL